MKHLRTTVLALGILSLALGVFYYSFKQEEAYSSSREPHQRIPRFTAGIYWGFFNPPTRAHRDLIVRTIKAAHLQKLYIIVNTDNSRKTCSASPEQRKFMVEQMLEDLGDLVEVQIRDEFNRDYSVFKRHKKLRSLVAVAGEDSMNDYRKSVVDSYLKSHEEIFSKPAADFDEEDDDEALDALAREEVKRQAEREFAKQISIYDGILIAPRRYRSRDVRGVVEVWPENVYFLRENPSVSSFSSTKVRISLEERVTVIHGLHPIVHRYIIEHDLYVCTVEEGDIPKE